MDRTPDVSAYMKAGYVVQCFTSQTGAYGYVGRQMAAELGRDWNEMLDDGCFIRYNTDTYNFEVNVGDADVPMYVPTRYYFDDNMVLTKD